LIARRWNYEEYLGNVRTKIGQDYVSNDQVLIIELIVQNFEQVYLAMLSDEMRIGSVQNLLPSSRMVNVDWNVVSVDLRKALLLTISNYPVLDDAMIVLHGELLNVALVFSRAFCVHKMKRVLVWAL